MTTLQAGIRAERDFGLETETETWVVSVLVSSLETISRLESQKIDNGLAYFFKDLSMILNHMSFLFLKEIIYLTHFEHTNLHFCGNPTPFGQ